MNIALAVIMFLAFPLPGTAAKPASQLALNGWELKQYRKAVVNAFGKPAETGKDSDGFTADVYILPGCPASYMVFSYPPERPDEVWGIQLTGEWCAGMLPFLGLRLGDSKSQVLQKLGSPDTVKQEDDPKLQLYLYDDRNFSVELTPDGKLYSIRIVGFAGFAAEPVDSPRLDIFAGDLKNKDLTALIDDLAPDMEIFRDGEPIIFSGSPAVELRNPDSAVARALFEAGGLRDILANHLQSADAQMRFSEENGGIQMRPVFKFPQDLPLQEIVYQWRAGRWRVWEISFRSPKPPRRS